MDTRFYKGKSILVQLLEKGLKVFCPERTAATVDHIVPTTNQARPFTDPLAEEMIKTLEVNCMQQKIYGCK